MRRGTAKLNTSFAFGYVTLIIIFFFSFIKVPVITWKCGNINRIGPPCILTVYKYFCLLIQKTHIPSALMIYLRYGLIHLSIIISDMIVSDLNFICYIMCTVFIRVLSALYLPIDQSYDFLSFQWRAHQNKIPFLL